MVTLLAVEEHATTGMRSCIFCDNRPSTKEDAWPLWLIRLLRTGPGRIDGERGGRRFVWRVVEPGLKVKFVCARCNNGWMSDLENRVKPIIETLVGEERVTLSSVDQATLATWAVKNAMVFEALRFGRSWFFAKTDRVALREALSPTPWTAVWIAKCVEPPGAFCSASNLSGVAGRLADQVKAYVTTMCFGPLAIQVLTYKLPSSVALSANVTAEPKPGPWEQVTIPIWPAQLAPVAWPPSLGLSGELGIEAFSKRWSQSDKEEPTPRSAAV